MIAERDVENPPLILRPTATRQLLPLILIMVGGLAALVVGMVLADLVFPEPTIWRLPVMVAVLSAAAVRGRGHFRRFAAAVRG